MACGWCGHETLEPGFIEDMGGQGYSRWIAGPLERGVFGGAKRVGKQRWAITAHRCTECGHLELFASQTI